MQSLKNVPNCLYWIKKIHSENEKKININIKLQ